MTNQQKRIRIFAGPNGSGKTTLYNQIKNEHKLDYGYYLNADILLEELKKKGFLDFKIFDLEIKGKTFFNFIKNDKRLKSLKEINKIDIWGVNNNIVTVNKNLVNAYDAAVLTDFIKEKLLMKGLTFTFETVMSHKSRVEFIKKAAKSGYKTYLYFISTSDPIINIQRIAKRKHKGGHDVHKDIIVKRYYNSLELLFEALINCHRAYIFDNSNNINLIASSLIIEKNKELKFYENIVPKWVDKFLIQKWDE